MSSNITPSKPSRPPAPALFVGPPSRNESSTSINITSSRERIPLSRQRSLLGNPPTANTATADPTTQSSSSPAANPTALLARRQNAQQATVEAQSTSRTDAIWVEMQNTLADVELSALSNTQVFNASHSSALAQLRAAQIGLAQAWAKSEADEDGTESGEKKTDTALGTTSLLDGERAGKFFKTGAGNAAGPGGEEKEKGRARGRSDGSESGKTQLEEDTENDILLARQRREANDRYFQRVNAGVLDVVAKLEEVAQAMKHVEKESKELWDDKDSVDGSLKTASVT